MKLKGKTQADPAAGPSLVMQLALQIIVKVLVIFGIVCIRRDFNFSGRAGGPYIAGKKSLKQDLNTQSRIQSRQLIQNQIQSLQIQNQIQSLRNG